MRGAAPPAGSPRGGKAVRGRGAPGPPEGRGHRRLSPSALQEEGELPGAERWRLGEPAGLSREKPSGWPGASAAAPAEAKAEQQQSAGGTHACTRRGGVTLSSQRRASSRVPSLHQTAVPPSLSGWGLAEKGPKSP